MAASPTSPVLCSAWAGWDDLTAEQQAAADPPTWAAHLLAASEVLFALSGRQWTGTGCGPLTVVLRSLRGAWPYDSTWGACGCWAAGQWLGETWIPPMLDWPAAHYTARAVRLPHPHPTITAVTIDAAPFTAWQVSGAGWLERTDGQGWPLCSNRTEVTYTHGTPPPHGGVLAAVSLGAELVKAAKGEKCRLPGNTVSISRQGVTQQRTARVELARDGLTGLADVDLWLRAVNPQGRARRARVWSPDLPGAARVPGV